MLPRLLMLIGTVIFAGMTAGFANAQEACDLPVLECTAVPPPDFSCTGTTTIATFVDGIQLPPVCIYEYELTNALRTGGPDGECGAGGDDEIFTADGNHKSDIKRFTVPIPCLVPPFDIQTPAGWTGIYNPIASEVVWTADEGTGIGAGITVGGFRILIDCLPERWPSTPDFHGVLEFQGVEEGCPPTPLIVTTTDICVPSVDKQTTSTKSSDWGKVKRLFR